eukprot:8269823-Ditylum_brightwellii.AAC.1
MHAFYLTSQKEGMTLEAYLAKFSNRRDVVEQCGGCAVTHPRLTEKVLREAGLNPDNLSRLCPRKSVAIRAFFLL